MYTFTALLTLLPLFVSAVFTPTTPDSTTVVKVGQNLNIAWTADTQGLWSNLEIQLMAGSNFAMQPLTTLTSGINAATTTSFSIPCPDVSPYSAIYFIQFTQGGNISTAEWTTRFTIAGADGSTTPPANTTTYSGTNVNWGNAVILSASNATGTSNSASASIPSTPVPSTNLATIYTSLSSSKSSATSVGSSTGAKASSVVSAVGASTTSAKSGAVSRVAGTGSLGVMLVALCGALLF